MREDVDLLYLVLRTLDDLVDLEAEQPGEGSAHARLAAIELWARGGRPSVPTRETLILDELQRRHRALPPDALADFTAGMRQDLAGPVIATEADLDAYCYRVAGTVGRLMAAILGAEGPAADQAARALGGAMQRTNVLRDIDEDLARGRCYLPTETLAAHGVRDLRTGDRRAVLRAEIALADADYERGMAGIPLLRHGRRSITAAALMYREILRQIERDGLGRRRPHRAVVSGPRKAMLVTRAMLRPGP